MAFVRFLTAIILLCFAWGSTSPDVEYLSVFEDDGSPSPYPYDYEFEWSGLSPKYEKIYLTARELMQFGTTRRADSPAQFFPRNSSEFQPQVYRAFEHVNTTELYGVWDSVVFLEMTYIKFNTSNPGDERMWHGTGFFVNQTHVVTAGHNVDACLFDDGDRFRRCNGSTPDDEKYMLKEVGAGQSPIFSGGGGVLVDKIIRPAQDIDYEWKPIHPRDVALLSGPLLCSRQWVNLVDVLEFDKNEISSSADLLVVGYPPRFPARRYVDLPRGRVAGHVLNNFYFGGEKRIATIGGRVTIQASDSIVTHRNPTYGGFSGSPACFVLRKRVSCIGVHVGGGFSYNSAVTTNVKLLKDFVKSSKPTTVKTELR